MSRSHELAQIRIGIISDNEATAAALLDYLQEVGVPAHRLTQQEGLHRADWSGTGLQALVLFPDDFAAPLVEQLLQAVTGGAPGVLQLIVTRHPQRYAPPLSAGRAAPGAAPRLHRCVLPRPTFGWHILDALRAHIDGDGDGDEDADGKGEA